MFKSIKNWWNGLWEKEPSPGPKITREDIAKVEETVKEIRSGKFDQVQPGNTLRKDFANISLNLDAQAAPVRPPKPKPIPRPEKGINIVHHTSVSVSRGDGNSYLMPVGQAANDDSLGQSLEETVAERLANPQIIKVGIEDLDGDTALPTPRKPRRRGKRGGVKRNRRNKNK